MNRQQLPFSINSRSALKNRERIRSTSFRASGTSGTIGRGARKTNKKSRKIDSGENTVIVREEREHHDDPNNRAREAFYGQLQKPAHGYRGNGEVFARTASLSHAPRTETKTKEKSEREHGGNKGKTVIYQSYTTTNGGRRDPPKSVRGFVGFSGSS